MSGNGASSGGRWRKPAEASLPRPDSAVAAPREGAAWRESLRPETWRNRVSRLHGQSHASGHRPSRCEGCPSNAYAWEASGCLPSLGPAIRPIRKNLASPMIGGGGGKRDHLVSGVPCFRR